MTKRYFVTFQVSPADPAG